MESQINRLESYKSESSEKLWASVPYSRRAAVLVILYKNHRDQLSTVLTVRSFNMRTYPGQAAFPGGRSDSISEEVWDVALREASEEIGFDPSRFKLRKLCVLPCYLSRNYLVVRPCVCFIEPINNANDIHINVADIAPKMNGAEVQVVYGVELQTFFHNDPSLLRCSELSQWAGQPWVYYEYEVPRNDHSEWVFEDPTSSLAESYASNSVTGLTAHMALDCARIAFGRNPDGFEFLPQLGFDTAVEENIKLGVFTKKKI